MMVPAFCTVGRRLRPEKSPFCAHRLFGNLLLLSLLLAGFGLLGSQAAWAAKTVKPKQAVSQARSVVNDTTQWDALGTPDNPGNPGASSQPMPGQPAYLSSFPAAQWWSDFQDPLLNQLIETALAQNPTLQAVETRIQQSQALAQVSRSALFPQLSVGAGYLWQQYGLNQFVFPLEGRTFHSFQIPLRASYEVDLWGKNRLASRASNRGILSAQLDYHQAVNQLSSLVASSYINLVRLDRLCALQTQLVENQNKLLMHTQRLIDYEQASADSLLPQQQRLQQTQADLAALEGSRQVAVYQLRVLLGQSPGQAALLERSSLLALLPPQTVPAGIPSDLVVHRPDIMRLENELETAYINIQVARREFLPAITINGESGLNAIRIRNLFKWTSLSSFLYPTLSQQLFTGGARRGNLKLRKAQYEEMLQRYMEGLLNAFQEVETALATQQTDSKIYEQVRQQAEASQMQSQAERRRYDTGLSSEWQWLNLEVQQLEYQKALAQQHAQRLIDHISVMKALGGGTR
ncbi:MAG: efflux transporter outer membrane subunit [Candidatus Melainabacteria bacterium]|nr:efflux transporter outer membrane subunit [Candidatus Melainabacteria bacterium]